LKPNAPQKGERPGPKRQPKLPKLAHSKSWRTVQRTICREASWNAVVAARPDNAASARKRTGQSVKWKARPAGFSVQMCLPKDKLSLCSAGMLARLKFLKKELANASACAYKTKHEKETDQLPLAPGFGSINTAMRRRMFFPGIFSAGGEWRERSVIRVCVLSRTGHRFEQRQRVAGERFLA
jgi:hypothetical protein